MSANSLEWVVLTVGDRPEQADEAIDSILDDGSDSIGTSCIVVLNGGDRPSAAVRTPVSVIDAGANLGVPGGRDLGMSSAVGEVVAFLDDDAKVLTGTSAVALEAFATDPKLGALAMRIVDEEGVSDRHHVPRVGRASGELGGEVTTFIGAGHALRAAAYAEVGGYFTDIMYGHEEIELCWRLIDAGWSVRYEPEAVVFHPRIEIGRRPSGWYQTGRNRVRIARRTLPWPVAIAHVGIWLVAGWMKAPARAGRSSYLSGWRQGWRDSVDHEPISWRGVWRLTRLGRPPVI